MPESDERRQPIFQAVPDGRIMAILNWRHRTSGGEALVAVPLSEGQRRRYRELREAGMADEQAFDVLFEPPHEPRLTLAIEDLTRRQLLTLLRELTGLDLPSAERLSRADLAGLLRALCAAREDCSRAILL